jgi:DNA-binding NarL/FixJ family response regulator
VISVVLVAPVRAYSDALAAVIEAESDIRVTDCIATASEALACLSRRQPAAALLDFSTDSLVTVMPSLRRTSPATRLIGIGISAQRQAEDVIRCAEEGLAGFVDADQPISDVTTAVRQAVRGESPCSPRIAALLLQALQRRPSPPSMPRRDLAPEFRSLTPRELVVAELAGLGLTNRQIASRLVLGESTVKSHLHSVLRKLGLDSRDQIALGRQLPPPDRGGEETPAPPSISIASPQF